MVPNTECVVAFWYRLSGEERETKREDETCPACVYCVVLTASADCCMLLPCNTDLSVHLYRSSLLYFKLSIIALHPRLRLPPALQFD